MTWPPQSPGLNPFKDGVGLQSEGEVVNKCSAHGEPVNTNGKLLTMPRAMSKAVIKAKREVKVTS